MCNLGGISQAEFAYAMAGRRPRSLLQPAPHEEQEDLVSVFRSFARSFTLFKI